MRSISKELAKLTKPTAPNHVPADPRPDHAQIMASSRRSGVADDELRRAAWDEWEEMRPWERQREAVVQARHFGGNAEVLGRALRFRTKAREKKFWQIVKRIEKETQNV